MPRVDIRAAGEAPLALALAVEAVIMQRRMVRPLFALFAPLAPACGNARHVFVYKGRVYPTSSLTRLSPG